jgi:hypothetical protein
MLFANDQVLEYLIRKHIEGPERAMMALMGRDSKPEDFERMEETIQKFFKGWVTINGNIRRLGKGGEGGNPKSSP